MVFALLGLLFDSSLLQLKNSLPLSSYNIELLKVCVVLRGGWGGGGGGGGGGGMVYKLSHMLSKQLCLLPPYLPTSSFTNDNSVKGVKFLEELWYVSVKDH